MSMCQDPSDFSRDHLPVFEGRASSRSLTETETKIRGTGLLYVFIAAATQAVEVSHLLDAY